MIFRNIALIYNPAAGGLRGRRARRLDRAVEALRARGHGVTPRPTEGPGTAGGIARASIEAGADLILGFGGDGTLNEALQGVAHSHVPLAMLPAGTANVLTREIGVGCNSLKAAQRLGNWVPQRVGLGLLRCEPDGHERYFLLMAGVGFDAHIVYRLSLPLKSRLGQVAYFTSAARELGRKLEQVQVEVGGHSLTCAFALANRVRNYAGYLRIARRASLIGPDFELVLFEAATALRLYLRYLAPVLFRRASNTRGMSFLRGRKICFTAAPGLRVYVQVDGEYAGRVPATIEVVADALTLLVPQSYVNEWTP